MRSTRRSRAVTALSLVALLATVLPSVASAAPARRPAEAAPSAATAAPCVRGSKACPIPVVFRPGAYTGQARAVFAKPTQEKWFSVRATAGQTMVVVIVGKGATAGTLYFPGGTQDGGPGGRVYDDQVPATGVTRIRVTEDMMAEQWTGPVTVVVMIY